MKEILKESNAIYYISESDMIKFINQNSDYEWNLLCDMIRKEGISADDFSGRAYWDKDNLYSKNVEDSYSEFAIKWLKHFFEAHPFIKKFMLVFDD